MKNSNLRVTRTLLLVALPLSALAASAQTRVAPSSITSFDKNGNAIIQPTSNGDKRFSVTSFDKDGNAIITPTSGDQNRSSVTTFDKGVPTITYTSPPIYPNLNPGGIQAPQSIAGLIANQNIYGQSAPNPLPGYYQRFDYNRPIYAPGYYPPYPAPSYGYPVPAYPVQQQAPYVVNSYGSNYSWEIPSTITSIPLNQGYAYPAPSYPYPLPSYPYPAPGYGYPAPVYPYPYGYGNGGYGTGTYSSNTANYGLSFGRGGIRASIGGSNTTTRSNSSTTITIR